MDTSNGFVCDRCHKPGLMHSLSFFNTEDCCMDCLRKEKAHPAYAEARRIEEEHVRRGDTNFPGVGKPADL